MVPALARLPALAHGSQMVDLLFMCYVIMMFSFISMFYIFVLRFFVLRWSPGAGPGGWAGPVDPIFFPGPDAG